MRNSLEIPSYVSPIVGYIEPEMSLAIYLMVASSFSVDSTIRSSSEAIVLNWERSNQF